MTISLSPQTQKLLEDRKKQGGYSNPDDAIRAALEISDSHIQLELDEETLAAIEEGEAQIDRGECRPWEELREELRSRVVEAQQAVRLITVRHGARRQPRRF